MSAGVGDVHPAGEHRGGRAARGEGPSVRGSVDPERGAGHHDPAPLGESGGQGLGHVRAVRGAGAGPDHGDRTQRPGTEVRPAPQPQSDGSLVAEVVELGRPLRRSREDEPAARLGGVREVPPGVGQRGPSAVPGEPLGPHPGRSVRLRPGAVSSRISRTAPNSRSHRPPCASPGSSTRVSAARASSSAPSEPVMSRLPAATSPRGRSRSAAPAPRPRPAPRADPVPAGRPRSRRRATPGPARGR